MNLPLSVAQMTKDIKSYAAAAGLRRDVSNHAFCSGGAISQALAGETLASIMLRAFWKRTSTTWALIHNVGNVELVPE